MVKGAVVSRDWTYRVSGLGERAGTEVTQWHRGRGP